VIAAPDCETVAEETSFDSFVLTDLLSYHDAADQVDDWHEEQQSLHATRLADLLANLARRVAGHEVRDDADGTVAEAAE